MFRSSVSRHLRRISSNLDHAESRVSPLGVTACRTMTYATTPLPEFTDFKTYADLYKFSITKQGEFWDRLGKSRVEWNKPYTQVMDCDFPKGKINYFLGGELNASVNCVDRHVREKPNHTALIWERDDGTNEFYTFRELQELVNRMANVLMDHGVQRGHTVAIYLPNSPIAAATMLACSRIGAIHSVIYSGFSPESVALRIQDAKAQVLVTANEVMRGGRPVHLKAIVDKALPDCPTMKHVLLAKLSPTQVSMADISTTGGGVARCEDLDPLLARASSFCEPVSMGAEDPLFILYTSGSTGKPKGVVHTHGGYLLFAGVTHKTCFDINPEEDVFGCVADIGWITGHTYIVYAPLFNGCTTLLFESTPSFPDHGRYWATVEKLRLTHLYCAPTVLRLLIRHSDKWVHRHDRSSLRVLGSVGEPINKEAWEWYYHVVGGQRCDIIDTWWQTETGGVLIAPRPSAPNEPIFPAMPMRPFYGVEPALLEPDQKPPTELKGTEATGALCIKQPWPGIARTLWGDHARFKRTYFEDYPGYYATGDAATRKPAAKNDSHSGYYGIAGRTDDVINVSGIRIGTAEIESTLASHPLVAESAVIDFPHPIKGSGIYAFVTLRESGEKAMASAADPHNAAEKLKTELRDLCKKGIARHAAPDIVLFTNNLPKTRSGKIMRRILRNIAHGKHGNLGDTSTLADPHVVVDLVKQHQGAWTAFLAPKQKTAKH